MLDQVRCALLCAANAAVSGRIATEGAEPPAATPEEYAADIDRAETKWSAPVKRPGAKAE